MVFFKLLLKLTTKFFLKNYWFSKYGPEVLNINLSSISQASCICMWEKMHCVWISESYILKLVFNVCEFTFSLLYSPFWALVKLWNSFYVAFAKARFVINIFQFSAVFGRHRLQTIVVTFAEDSFTVQHYGVVIEGSQ